MAAETPTPSSAVSKCYGKIPKLCFSIIFVIEDMLELGNLVSGAYFTYDTYQRGFRTETLHPGCENGDDDFALTPLDSHECYATLTSIWEMPECSSADVSAGDYCLATDTNPGVCDTDPELENCGLNASAIYKAVPQDCKQFFTASCSTIKKALCVTSTVAMVVAIGLWSCFHYMFMVARLDPPSGVDKKVFCRFGALLFCLLFGCIVFVFIFLVARGEEDVSLIAVAFCSAVAFGFGLVVSAVAGFVAYAGERGDAKWIARSSVFQLPCISLIAALAAKPERAKQLHEKRAPFKIWLRLGKDVPDLIIAGIDMLIFDFSVANSFNFLTSASAMIGFTPIVYHWLSDLMNS